MAQISINPFTGTGEQRGRNPLFDYTTGKVSRLLVAESATFQNETFVDANFYAQQMPLLTASLGSTGDEIDQDWLDGTDSSNFKELGILTPGGDTSFNLTGDGSSLFAAGITNAENPSTEDLGTAGSTTVKASGVIGHDTNSETTLSGLTPIPEGTGEPGRRITVTFDATLTKANMRAPIGQVLITGEDAAGHPIDDTIPVNRNETAQKIYHTKKFFRGTITSIKTRGFNGTVTAAFTAVNAAKRVVHIPYDAELKRWHGVYQQVGDVPNVLFGGVMNTMTLSLTQGSTLTMGINWMGKRYLEYANFQNTGALYDPAAISGLGYAGEDVLPFWAGELILDGVPMPITDCTCTISRNMENSNVIAGVQHQAFPPYTAEKRTIELSGNMLYSKSLNLQRKWRDRDTMSAVLSLSFGTDRTGKVRRGSFDFAFRVLINAMQLSSAPNPEISARGEQIQPFSLMAIKLPDSPTEYNIECDHSSYTAVANRS